MHMFPAACFSGGFFGSLFLLFDVQIAACQLGLEAVSKLEVSKLISSSITETPEKTDCCLMNQPNEVMAACWQ